MADIPYGPAFKRSLEQIIAASLARIEVRLTGIVAKYLATKESR
jgi:hypothetical protein